MVWRKSKGQRPTLRERTREAQVDVESEAEANRRRRAAGWAGSGRWDSSPVHSDTWSV